jgi:fatty acid desaturase
MTAVEDPAERSTPQTPTLGEKYDPAEHREHTRARLAAGLAFLLAIVALLLITLTASGSLSLDTAKDLAAVIFSPIVVLTGTALGFYFGVHQDGR